MASHIVNELDGGNGTKSAAVLLVTIWELGEAAGPLLIAPLSEIFGRYPLINACNVLFIATTMMTALSQSTTMLITTRAVTGMAVASNVLNPAIVGDIFVSDQRGAVMSLVMFASLVGGTIGPAVSGMVAQSLGWRAVIWMGVGLAGICQLVFFTCFRETYKVTILRKRAAKQQKETGKSSTTSDFGKETRLEKGFDGLRTSIVRPVAVLFDSGVLAALSLFGAVIYSYLYIVSVTLPDILEDIYGFTPAETGWTFLANGKLGQSPSLQLETSWLTWCLQGLGSSISVVICNLYLDKIYIKLRAANNGIGLPEHRLPIAIIGALTLPPALALYGWSAEYKLPLVFVLLSVVWIRLSLMLAYVPLIAYVVDACGLYSASALTGIIVIRCLASSFLPLMTTLLAENLGYGWGLTILGAISLDFALIPILMLKYGSQWRQHSHYTKTI